MKKAAAKGRRLSLLAAVCLLSTLLLVPTAEASRNLTNPLVPVLPPPAMPDLVFEESDAEPLPRHRLFGDLSLLERPLDVVAIQKTASGVFSLGIQSNIGQTGSLGQNRSGPSFQGLWTDPVIGIAYARNRWYDARTASWLSEDPMGAVDSPNLYAGFGLMPHAVTDPLGEAIRIHMFTRKSGLSEEQQQRLAGLIVRYFKRLPWAGEADVTIGMIPRSFEDYETLKGPFAWWRQGYQELAPRAMEVERPGRLAQAEEYFSKYPDFAERNRQKSAAQDFEYHVYAELLSQPGKQIGESMHLGGETTDGRSEVFGGSFTDLIDADRELVETHGELLDLLYTSQVAAHEIGHQFGLSPIDEYDKQSGRGVMATRGVFGGHIQAFLNRLSQFAASKGGYSQVTSDELEDLWFEIFHFTPDDAKWILHLADPKEGAK